MEEVKVTNATIEPATGTAGLDSQIHGNAASVSAAAEATGGLTPGGFIRTDVDEQLFRFKSDDTPLMSLMLYSKAIKVNSPEVEHYMIDEARSFVTLDGEVEPAESDAVEIKVKATDKALVQPYSTLLVKGVKGADGNDLMLFVVGKTADKQPIVRACNGTPGTGENVTAMPAIPAGTELVILSNALYETQKEVAPDMIVPQPTTIYLQKRGMNQIVSDYFESQAKAIPFSKAIIAEQAIANFKVRGNRTLWAGRKSKFKIETKLGLQNVYTTEGVRWQFKKELQHTGKWTIDKFIALAKMFFTGEDVPKTAYLLAGKNLLEQIQCIDYSNHPEISISTKTNPIGWSVTNIHTVFGDIEVKREPTLDRLGWSNSGALIGEGRLVHYQYSAEHSFNENVEGEEAKRNGILVWDGLALKGSCHIWIDGDNEESNVDAVEFGLWDNAEAAPSEANVIYYLMVDCPSINASAKAGQYWQKVGSTWTQYVGEIYAK